MIQKNDIFLQEVAEALQGKEAPRVDVTQKVMDALPLLMAPRKESKMRIVMRIGVAAAACLLMLVAIDIGRLYSHDYDEVALGAMMAKTNDADVYFSDYVDCESAIGFDFASLDY